MAEDLITKDRLAGKKYTNLSKKFYITKKPSKNKRTKARHQCLTSVILAA
jgi:hypothetical protein